MACSVSSRTGTRTPAPRARACPASALPIPDGPFAPLLRQDAYARQGLWAPALELLRQMASDGYVEGSLLLDGCDVDEVADDDEAVAAPEDAPQDVFDICYQPRPDVISLNTALAALGRAGEWARALALLDEFLNGSGEVRPDSVSFTTVLGALGRAKRWEEAVDTLARMWHTGGIAIGIAAYSAALGASTCGSVERELALLSAMEERDVPPDLARYRLAIYACKGQADWANASCLLDEAVRLGLRPDESIYSAVLGACAKARRWDEQYRIYSAARDAAEVDLGAVTTTLMLSSASKSGRWRRALELFDDLKQRAGDAEGNGAGERGPSLDLACYSSAIHACECGGQWKRALGLLAELRAEGLTPDHACYTSAVQAVCGCGVIDEGRRLLDEMEADGALPPCAPLRLTPAPHPCASSPSPPPPVAAAECRRVHAPSRTHRALHHSPALSHHTAASPHALRTHQACTSPTKHTPPTARLSRLAARPAMRRRPPRWSRSSRRAPSPQEMRWRALRRGAAFTTRALRHRPSRHASRRRAHAEVVISREVAALARSVSSPNGCGGTRLTSRSSRRCLTRSLGAGARSSSAPRCAATLRRRCARARPALERAPHTGAGALTAPRTASRRPPLQ